MCLPRKKNNIKSFLPHTNTIQVVLTHISTTNLSFITAIYVQLHNKIITTRAKISQVLESTKNFAITSA